MIKIIGAGYAGLSSAISLALAGESVNVFDKASFVGSSELENFKAIRNYDLDVDLLDLLKSWGFKLDSNVFFPINKITKFAPSGRKMTVFSENGKPLFYTIRKGNQQDSLDMQLYEQAISEGVKFQFSRNMNLSSGDILSVNAIFRNISAYGHLYKGVNVNPHEILFFMDNRYAPNGYLYLIPFGKHEIVIAATTFDMTCSLPILLNKFIIENEVISKIIEGGFMANTFTGSAYCNYPKTAEIRGIKFIGASAGFVEAGRGFGVRYALQSGKLASDSIIKKKNYDYLWKNAFGKDLETGLKRRLLLEQMSNDDYEKLVLEDIINIKRYDKYPGVFKDLILSSKISSGLTDWQKKYDLQKIFS
jgi:flavin-dependent dehydrogenase